MGRFFKSHGQIHTKVMGRLILYATGGEGEGEGGEGIVRYTNRLATGISYANGFRYLPDGSVYWMLLGGVEA